MPTRCERGRLVCTSILSLFGWDSLQIGKRKSAECEISFCIHDFRFSPIQIIARGVTDAVCGCAPEFIVRSRVHCKRQINKSKESFGVSMVCRMDTEHSATKYIFHVLRANGASSVRAACVGTPRISCGHGGRTAQLSISSFIYYLIISANISFK